MTALTIAGGLLGIRIGALLSRRNPRRGQTEKLLADALDDVIGAIRRLLRP